MACDTQASGHLREGGAHGAALRASYARRGRRFQRIANEVKAISLVSLVLATAAPAAILTVTTLGDSGAGSLRGTIAAAASGDSITFAVTGGIKLTGGELLIDKALTIEGPGARLLSLVGVNARIFHITAGPSAISGLTIRDGAVVGRGQAGVALSGSRETD